MFCFAGPEKQRHSVWLGAPGHSSQDLKSWLQNATTHTVSQTERHLERSSSSKVPSDTSFCVVLQWYRSINDTDPSADLLIYTQYIYLIILRIQFLWFNQFIIWTFHYNHGLSEFSVPPWSWQMLCAWRRDRVDVKMDWAKSRARGKPVGAWKELETTAEVYLQVEWLQRDSSLQYKDLD